MDNPELRQLEVNIRALVTRVRALQTENQSLKARIEVLTEQVNVQKKAETETIDSHKFVKIAQENSPGESSEELKKLIDRYVGEIDKCIELLSE